MRFRLALAVVLAPLAASAGEPRPFAEGSWPALRALHAGRPTIVHFWGLTCAPCLVELPQWGRLAHRREDADVVMVAADPVAEDPARLAAALAKAGLGEVESWRFDDDFAERLQFDIDPSWHGELPLSVMLGRDKSAKTVVGGIDFAELDRWLDDQSRAP